MKNAENNEGAPVATGAPSLFSMKEKIIFCVIFSKGLYYIHA